MENLQSQSPPTYVVLAECNGKQYETWYTFIKYQGNEKALEYLDSQLKQVEFYILDDLSTFDLDLENKVSAETAKQMTAVQINSIMAHRKFDGTLKNINLGLRSKHSNDRKIVKTFDILGIGKIDDFVDGEDVDPDTEGDASSSDFDDSDSGDGTEYEYQISDSSEEEVVEKHREEKLSRKEQQRRHLVDKLKRMKGLGAVKK